MSYNNVSMFVNVHILNTEVFDFFLRSSLIGQPVLGVQRTFSDWPCLSLRKRTLIIIDFLQFYWRNSVELCGEHPGGAGGGEQWWSGGCLWCRGVLWDDGCLCTWVRRYQAASSLRLDVRTGGFSSQSQGGRWILSFKILVG